MFVFSMLSFKPAFLCSSFTFIQRLFSSSWLSAIRVVSSAYLRLLIFLPAILLPACASSSPTFYMKSVFPKAVTRFHKLDDVWWQRFFLSQLWEIKSKINMLAVLFLELAFFVLKELKSVSASSSTGLALLSYRETNLRT